MIDLYYWGTPNGQKPLIFLEEAELNYNLKPINIGKGEQFEPNFLKISPNNKIPAIVDQSPPDAAGPLAIFESGAILWYLSEKTGKFLPSTLRGKLKVSEWLFWQVGGLGPMSGQLNHFKNYAQDKIEYAIDRYSRETHRLYKVLNTQLKGNKFVIGNDYTIADIAVYPWIVAHKNQQIDLAPYPEIQRWYQTIESRPAVKKAYEIAEKISPPTGPLTDEARKHLFGHAHHAEKNSATQGAIGHRNQ